MKRLRNNLAYQQKILLLHPFLQVAFRIFFHEVVAFLVSYQLSSLHPEVVDQVFFQHVLFLKQFKKQNKTHISKSFLQHKTFRPRLLGKKKNTTL